MTTLTSTKSISILQRLTETHNKRSSLGTHSGLPMFIQQGAAAILILLLSPILLLTFLLIKKQSIGPAVFSQVRVGENGRHFVCYKFRSMYLPADPNYVEPQQSDREGVCKKFYQDPRVTSIGRIIRKYSIDELPQLFNVLKGDMALVGPRPHIESEYKEYDRNIFPRLFCKPGLTGLWQVNGRADTTFEQQLELDKTYILKQSWWLDVKILLATIPAVLGAKGAY